jgi:hypothetical protein
MDNLSKRLSIAVTLVLLLSLVLVNIPVKAQTSGSIVINPDGSLTGTYGIQQVGSIYTLTGNISGSIQVEKSNIVINGAGYTLDGNNNGGVDLTNNVQHDPNNPTISNVTIENLYILNGGVSTNGGGSDKFYNDFISSIMFLGDCDNNNITYCFIGSINFDYSGNAIMTENNINGSILVWLSNGGLADRNYWSDYLTKYPNATEADHSGVGNQPYVYSTAQNGTQTIYYQDNHPLMKPVTIPLMGSNPQASIPEFSLLAILLLLISILSFAVILRHRKNASKLSK